MKDLILVLGPLLGVVIGGAIAWLNTRFQTNRQELRERKQLILGKLEQLHQLLTEFIDYSQCLTFKAIRDPNKLQRVTTPPIEPVPFSRIEMLVGFYAPQLVEYVKKVAAISEEYAVPFTRLYGDEDLEDSERALICSSVSRLNREIIETCGKLQDEIITLSKTYL